MEDLTIARALVVLVMLNQANVRSTIQRCL
jgi:hypothetical protein